MAKMKEREHKSVSMRINIWELLDKLSKSENRSLSNLIESLILEGLKKRGLI